MNWDALGAIGEIAGALAVVITLLFLSKQLRDTSKQLILNSTNDANKLYSDAFWPIYNNEYNLRIWVTGLRKPEELSEDELEVFKLFMTRLMAVFDSVVEHNEQGIFSEDRFRSYAQFTLQFLDSPGGRMWQESGQFKFTPAAEKTLSAFRGNT
jgi:hypothetical protein